MSGRFSEVRVAHSGGSDTILDIACDVSGRVKKFATCANDGSLWIWESTMFSDLDLKPDMHEISDSTHSCVAWNFATCANDGSLWIWESTMFSDLDLKPDMHEISDSTHSCVAWNDTSIYMGVTTTDCLTHIEKRVVGVVSTKNFENEQNRFAFALDTTAIDVSADYLVCGSSDFSIKRGKKDVDYDKIELDGQPISIVIDPREEFFAVSCTDGSVSVYPLEGTDRVAHFEKMFQSFGDIDPIHSRVRLVWSRDGSHLYVPCVGGIKVIDRDWNLSEAMFTHDKFATATFSCTCISPCGKYLVSSTMDANICVWNTADRSLIADYEYHNKGAKVAISAMEFDPSNAKNIVIADVKKGVCVLFDAIPKISRVEKSTARAVLEAFVSDDDNDFQLNRSKRSRALIDDEADDDIQMKDGEERGFEEEEDEETRMSTDLGAIKKKFGFSQEDNFDADIDNRPDTFRSGFDEENRQKSFHPSLPPVISFKPPQLPSHFVSGGVGERTTSGVKLKKRYLKWNQHGMVRWLKEEEDSNIEIEFHDASISPEICIPNKETKYSMADLCDQAIVLANKERGEKQSELLVIHLTSWDSDSRRWTTSLPIGDGAIDVLVNKEGVIVITKKGNIRMFTLTGTQRHVISHPAPIVSACSTGSSLAIVSVRGGPYWITNEEEEMEACFEHEVTIYNIPSRGWYGRNGASSKTFPLPLPNGSCLSWVGFTNQGQLCAMDSTSTLRLYTPCGFWMPVFEGSEEMRAKSDTLWPISVTESPNRQFRYIYCRGSSHPLMEVKQAPVIASWTLPLCNAESDKSKLEAELLFNELRQSELLGSTVYGCATESAQLSSTHLSTLIKLFALAVRSDKEGRASELATFCNNSKGIQSMCNYAAKQKRNMLVDKVSTIGQEQLAGVSVSSSTNGSIREELAPRKVVQRRRESVVDEERQREMMKYAEEEEEGERDTTTHLVDTSILVPTPTNGKNPFKRTLDVSSMSDVGNTSSLSVFDQLDTSINMKNKRARENDEKVVTTPRAKQSKLSFGNVNKENVGMKEKQSCSPFDLWLSANESRLRNEFTGDEMDFSKYCAQHFRMLPPAQKKEWKARAESQTTEA